MTAPTSPSDPELAARSRGTSTHLLERRRRTTRSAAVDALLADAQRRADAFAARYAGKVAELDGPGLVAAMRELGRARRSSPAARAPTRPGFSDRHRRPARGALLQRVQEKGDRDRDARCCSSSSSGRRSTTTRAEELLATDGLDFARHHLRTARRYRPHLLTEPEERILTEKALSGRTAWARLFEEQAAAIEVDAAGDGASRWRSRSRCRGCSRPTARCAATPPSASPRRCSRACARAPTRSTRCWRTRWSTTGCATTRTGWPPQPRQRGVRRVGRRR